VTDLLCTSGPRDRPFEEQHSWFSIAIVLAGSFQYRSSLGQELMTPGSLLLGNPGQYFECGHEHGAGDRCVSFQFSPEYFERIAEEAEIAPRFHMLRLPPLRELSSLTGKACAALQDIRQPSWEELSLQVAGTVLRHASGNVPPRPPTSASSLARVTRVVRKIERNWHTSLTLGGMAREAGLSPFHFLRIFEQLTGLTPHQYLLRTRLREAAMQVMSTPAKVLDVALGCGFRDVSNFNRNFRAEFQTSPRAYRAAQ
jgi:AraC-like DNA-binding protein